MSQPTLLVTGASSGIGRAVAVHYSKLGFQVFATVRKESDADSLKAESVGLCTPVIMDVTNEESVVKGVAQITAACGDRGLNCLVCNAGVPAFGPMELAPLETWSRLFEVNVFAVATVTRHCLPLLRLAAARSKAPASSSDAATASSTTSSSSKSGPSARVLMVGSAAGRLASPMQSVYSASKHAVEGLVDSIRAELAPQGIRVVCMQLGAVQSALSGKMRQQSKADAASAPPHITALYQATVDSTLEMYDAMESKAIPMQVVLRAFDDAVTSANPRTRYAVDSQIGMAIWLRWALSDRMWDWLYPKLMNMSKSGASKKKN